MLGPLDIELFLTLQHHYRHDGVVYDVVLNLFDFVIADHEAIHVHSAVDTQALCHDNCARRDAASFYSIWTRNHG